MAFLPFHSLPAPHFPHSSALYSSSTHTITEKASFVARDRRRLQRSRHRIVSLYRSNRVESSVLTFFLIFYDRCSRGEREENYLRSGRLRRVVIIDETKCTYECINALPGRLKIQHTCEGEKFREMMTSNRSNNRRRRWNPIAQYQPSFTHISTSACSFFNDPRYHNANFLRSFVDMLDFTSFAIKWKFSTKLNL